MKLPDLDRIRSEQSRSLAEFLKLYNANLTARFRRAYTPLLEEFRSTHAEIFKQGTWSLDMHRKKVMDWLCTRPV